MCGETLCAAPLEPQGGANLGGRVGWAAISDQLGRRNTFHLFTFGSIPLYCCMPTLVSAVSHWALLPKDQVGACCPPPRTSRNQTQNDVESEQGVLLQAPCVCAPRVLVHTASLSFHARKAISCVVSDAGPESHSLILAWAPGRGAERERAPLWLHGLLHRGHPLGPRANMQKRGPGVLRVFFL